MKILDQNSPILDYHVEKVPKAYPAYFDTYADIQKLIDYLDSIRNLYCLSVLSLPNVPTRRSAPDACVWT